MLRLRNRLLPLLRAASSLPSPIHPGACHHLLSTSTSTPTVPAPFSLEDYLVASCGLAPAQASEVSKKASRSRAAGKEGISRSRPTSASKPDAIIALLADAGLSRADIAAVVSADPLLLRSKVDNIARRLVALRDRVGLSPPQIASFLLVGSFDRALLAAKRNWSFLWASLDKTIKPNIALFRQHGVPDVAKVCLSSARVLTLKPERVKEILLRAEELGVPATSPLFRQAVAVVSGVSREKVAARIEFFKRTLGCSESEGLLDGNMNIFQVVHYNEEAFKSKFIDCHMDSVPALADACAEASAGIVPSRV